MESQVIKKEWFVTNRPGKLNDYYTYDKEKVLGQGAYGCVFKAVLNETNQERAVKMIAKRSVSDQDKFRSEINILRNLDHPNIIKLYETFEDARNIYLVMELCTGGELFDRIIEKSCFTEAEAQKTIQQIVKAINYLHSNKICHRDLKPENFMYLNKSEDSPIKMIDFGTSKLFENTQPQQQQPQQNSTASNIRRRKSNLQTKVGTPYYIAPEVLSGDYDESCDIWSCGVLLYILLCGYPPFNGRNDAQIMDNVRKGIYQTVGKEWDIVSDSAKDLISKMINKPEKRLKPSEVLKHPWMTQVYEVAAPTLDLNIATLRQFVGFDRLKKTALTYIASRLGEHEIIELKRLFEKLDEDGNGMLSIEEIKKGLKNVSSQNIAELEKVISKVDTDQSGLINYTEFLAATIETSVYLKEEKLAEAFRLFDKNGDGRITADEIKQVLGNDNLYISKPKSYWENIIKEADKNGDGVIDYDEFIDMMSNLTLQK